MRSMLIVIFVVISVLSPIFHIATTTALASHAQDPKLTNNEMSALKWLNNRTSSKDGVLSDPTFLQYVNTFTNARAVLSTDSENSYVVTHQLSHLTDLANFMNGSTDSCLRNESRERPDKFAHRVARQVQASHPERQRDEASDLRPAKK